MTDDRPIPLPQACRPCPHGDPACPCQDAWLIRDPDGTDRIRRDPCHYEGPDAMPCPEHHTVHADLTPREPDPATGMGWDDVRDFLDHMRTTCLDDRQTLKLRVRDQDVELAALTRTNEALGAALAFCYQTVPELRTTAPDHVRRTRPWLFAEGIEGVPI